MKKIILALAIVASAMMAQANSMKWSYSSSSSENGYTVYLLLGSTVKTDWESASDIASAAISSAAVAKSGKKYVASGTASNDSLVDGASIYFAIVSTADPATYAVTAVTSAANTYGATDAAGSSLVISGFGSFANFSGGGSGGGTPEPTSGLLLLVGGAMLALRRKQK